MPEALYIDLLIADGDLVLDAGGQPVLVEDRACVAQDLMHMILDSFLLTEMIGNRDKMDRRRIMVEISKMVDDDVRIIPGSTSIKESEPGKLWLTAKTMDFGEITFTLGIP